MAEWEVESETPASASPGGGWEVESETPADDHGLAERQKLSPIGKALNPITSYPATYGQMNREAREQVSRGVGQIMHPASNIDPQAHGFTGALEGAHSVSDSLLSGIGNIAGGGLNYLASPIMAGVRSIGSQPIEDVTGLPRDWTEFASGFLAPEMLKLPVPGEARVPGGPRVPGAGAMKVPEDFTPPAREPPSTVPRQMLRPEAGVDLLPADTPHTLPPERRSLSAMGASGPLSNISDETIAHMRKVMEEQGFTPHTIDQRLGELSEHHMFGEVTPSLEADMGAVAAPPGPGKLEVIGSLRQRAVEARERVQNIFNRAFGVNENVAQLKRIMDVDRQKAASPFYERFRNTVITPTPEIEALMPRLQASGALQAANRSLQLEGEPLSHGFIDFAGQPPTVTHVPTASAFQYAKEALDDKIGAAVRAGERNEARRLVGLQKAMLSALDNHPQVGDIWRQARTTYAQPTEIMKGVDFGKQILTNKVDVEELPFLTAAYSEPQMRAARIGMRSHLENILGKRDALTAEAINTALSPNNVQKMRWMIGDEATDQMVNAMEAERHMHTAPTRIHGGSQTALRTEAQKRWTVEPQKGGVTVHDVTGAAHRPVRTAVTKGIEKAAERFGAARHAKEEARMERLREEASRIFTLQGPERDAVARFLVGGPEGAALPPPTRAEGGRVNDFLRARHAFIKKQGGGELSDDQADGELPPDDQAAMMPETFVNPAVKGLISGMAQQVATPGKLMQKNPYPAGSEEADWYDRKRQDVGEDWARDMALNTMGTGAVAGVPLRAGEMALGAGAIRATPEAIARAAKESAKGITQPELRNLYGELGLTGGEPSDLVKPSLNLAHPDEARQAAISLKLADREAMRSMTPEEQKVFQKTGELPGGALLPSQEASREATEAYIPTKKDVKRAEVAFDKAVARGIKPSVFDLSPKTLKQVPDVEQFPLPRVAPQATERLGSVGQGGLRRIESAARAAPEENWGWYNLMQARDLFHSIHGPQKGEQAFQAWLDGVAGTSMVNPIDNNIRSSTWYLQQLLQGKHLPETIGITDPVTGKTVRTMVGGPPPGYGAKSQIQHADRVKEYLTNTYDPVSNPKPISYRTNLGGNWMPRTVDTHDIRNMVGMPNALKVFGADEASLLPKEYSYLEQLGQRAANRAGMSQAAQQAATWVGGGKYTGLKSYPAPLLEALNRRAHVTGMVRGQSATDALIAAFSGRAPLL